MRNSINLPVGRYKSDLNLNLLYSFILLIELLEVILFLIDFHNSSKI